MRQGNACRTGLRAPITGLWRWRPAGRYPVVPDTPKAPAIETVIFCRQSIPSMTMPSPNLRKRLFLALAAGALSATGFAPLGLWPLTMLCFTVLAALITSAVSRRDACLSGWLFGVGHFTVGNNWIATAFTHQSAMPHWLGWIAVLLLSLYLALFPALAALASRWIAPRGGIPFALALAGFWIITEWLRSGLFTGFAWNPLGVLWVENWLGQISRWTGTYGLSGLTMLLATIPVAFARKTPKWSSRLLLARPGAIIVAISIALAAGFIGLPRADQGSTRRVTVVQPNIGQDEKYDPLLNQRNFQKLSSLSTPAFDEPTLLLWPEAAIPDFLESGYPARYYIDNRGGSAVAARMALARLLRPDDLLATGAVTLDIANGQAVGARNGVALLGPDARLKGYYAKAHLVPYGEYLPLRWLLEPIGLSRLVPGSLDFWPGPGPQTINLGRHGKMGLQVCYEIIFSGQVIDDAHRPDFLFNPSNDAWFGSWGPPQHLAQARLRAIEEAMPVVRATPTGISAIIDARGRILQAIAPGHAGRIDARLPRPAAPTFFSRWGNNIPVAISLLMIICAVAISRRRV